MESIVKVVVKREIVEEDFGSGAVQMENMQGQCMDKDKGPTEETSLDGVQLWWVKNEPSESEDPGSRYHQDFDVHKETVEMDNNHVYKWTVPSSETVSMKISGIVTEQVKVAGGTVTEPMKVDGGTVTEPMKMIGGTETEPMKVKKAEMALKYMNLRESLKNNWSFLYNCTNENCIEYLKFYHGEATTIQLSVKIRSDFTPLIQVHGKHISPEHDFWSGLPEKYTTPADIVKLLTKLHGFTVCMGNPDKEYQSLIKSHVESRQPPQAYVEGDFGAVKDGVSYTSSIRSIACELLTKYNRCRKCILYRNTLTKEKTQETKDRQNAPSDLMSYKKSHIQINSEEFTAKLEQALEQAKTLSEENEQLRQQMTRKDDVLQKSGGRTIGTAFVTEGELNMGTYLSTSESGHVPQLNDFTIVIESNDKDTPAHKEDGSKDGTTTMVVPTEMSTNKDFQAKIGSQGGGPHEGLVLKAMNSGTKMNSVLRENDADFTNNHVLEKNGNEKNKSGLLIEGDPGTSVYNLNEEAMKGNGHLNMVHMQGKDHLNMVHMQGKDHLNMVHMQIREQFDKVVKDHLNMVQDCDVNKRNELDTKFNTPLMLPQNLDNSSASQIGVRHEDEKPIQSNETAEMFNDHHPVAAPENPHPDLECGLPSLVLHCESHQSTDMHDCKECGKAFPQLQDLKKHARSHHARKTFKCRRCKKIFPSLSFLVAHRKVHTVTKHVKCDKCGKAFSNAFQLQSHAIREHWDDHQFKCNKCDKVFSQYSALAKHRKAHIVEKPFKCRICNRAYATNYVLMAHVKTHASERPYKCTQCSKTYFSSSSLKSHMRIHTGERPYKCKPCGKAYISFSSLHDHMMVHSGEKPYECEYCDKCFHKKSTLTTHRKTHTGEKPYKCDCCLKAFSRATSLKKHIAIHTGEKPFKCKLCKMAFYRSDGLTSHQIVHSSVKPYKCELCGKSYAQSTDLEAHLMVHKGEKPKSKYAESFKCEICEKEYARASYYKTHMRIHTGERPYRCQECGKSFNQKGTLDKHMKTHSGEKPFQCNLCKKAFKQNICLKRHAVTHSGEKPHTCEQCGLGFSLKWNLVRHQRTHTGEKPFQCEQCGKAFIQSTHLIAHTKTHKSRSNNAGSRIKAD